MGLPTYPRPTFGPSRLGLHFGLAQRGLYIALGDNFFGLGEWAYEPISLILSVAPQPLCTEWARAVTLFVSVAISTCLLGDGLIKA